MRLRVASSLSNSWAKEPIEAVDSGRRCRKTLREPVSVNSRTSLRSAEMEIGKWRAETGARNPCPKDENARNCRPETGARQPNPREYQRFSQTRKNQPGDRTAWLGDLDSNHDYRSQSLFPGPPWGALTRLPTSPGETLGLQDMEDSFQVTCPYCGETVELLRVRPGRQPGAGLRGLLQPLAGPGLDRRRPSPGIDGTRGWVGIAKVTSGPASARRSHP